MQWSLLHFFSLLTASWINLVYVYRLHACIPFYIMSFILFVLLMAFVWPNQRLYASREISLDFSVFGFSNTCILHTYVWASTWIYYTLYLHCFSIFGILTGCKPQYIALYCVNFPWRFFFSLSLFFLVVAHAAAVTDLSFVCLFVHWNSIGCAWRGEETGTSSTSNDANKRLISLSLFVHLVRFVLFYFASLEYVLVWIGGLV